jgi:hypothetical protein
LREPQSLASTPQSAANPSHHRGDIPQDDPHPGDADTCLNRYECGGYLFRSWTQSGRLDLLPDGWARALARAHRKTVVDNLAALAEFRVIGRHLVEEGVPFLILKGGAYLIDLYADPGERRLTDIDMLVHRGDVPRLARRLAAAGYHSLIGDLEFRRFEIGASGEGRCRFEFHWWLGLPLRVRIDQTEVWERSSPANLEGVLCRRLHQEDALLYHVAHQADHYFGPSLKWTIDFQEMLRHWQIDLDSLARRAREWRVCTALYLALRHLEKLFPGAAPATLMQRVAPGRLRRSLLRPYLASDPLQLLSVSNGIANRYPLRCLLIDRPVDVVGSAARVLLRPVALRLGLGSRIDEPWTWRD